MARKPKQKLLFVDTNILLDFYRARNDAGLSLLGHLDNLHDRIITTFQVEMEFRKHRLNAIAESFRLLKAPDAAITPPAFLKEAKTIELMKKNLKNTSTRIAGFKKRILAVVQNPTLKDPVHQMVQRLFSDKTRLNLHREHSEVGVIKRKAWRRFITGCPPRKKDDTSIGDAINWEWILRCVEVENEDVIVVSRDGDYGTGLDDVVFANDALVSDVKRINQQRKVIVMDRLSDALKQLSVQVSSQEESEENALVERATVSANVPLTGVSAAGTIGYAPIATTVNPHYPASGVDQFGFRRPWDPSFSQN